MPNEEDAVVEEDDVALDEEDAVVEEDEVLVEDGLWKGCPAIPVPTGHAGKTFRNRT